MPPSPDFLQFCGSHKHNNFFTGESRCFFLIHLHPLEESTASLIQHKSPLISMMSLQANFLLPTMLSHQVMRSAAVECTVAPGKKLP